MDSHEDLHYLEIWRKTLNHLMRRMLLDSQINLDQIGVNQNLINQINIK